MENGLGYFRKISDESGEDELGQGYLLKYEGWSGICVGKAWAKVKAEQRRKGIATDRKEAEEERKDACYQYSREQSFKIIESEWMPRLNKRKLSFLAGGYDDGGGLYGKTWAPFKRDG